MREQKELRALDGKIVSISMTKRNGSLIHKPGFGICFDIASVLDSSANVKSIREALHSKSFFSACEFDQNWVVNVFIVVL